METKKTINIWESRQKAPAAFTDTGGRDCSKITGAAASALSRRPQISSSSSAFSVASRSAFQNLGVRNTASNRV